MTQLRRDILALIPRPHPLLVIIVVEYNGVPELMVSVDGNKPTPLNYM